MLLQRPEKTVGERSLSTIGGPVLIQYIEATPSSTYSNKKEESCILAF